MRETLINLKAHPPFVQMYCAVEGKGHEDEYLTLEAWGKNQVVVSTQGGNTVLVEVDKLIANLKKLRKVRI